ncbi:MAG: hypothetical protein KDD55_02410 [Bdellovibrionales bacterium]|nr:hypothetical protein [Bdellovibrionales bacterium]
MAVQPASGQHLVSSGLIDYSLLMHRYLSLILTALCLLFVLGCRSSAPIPMPEPEGEKYIERGRELAQGLASCGFCHGLTSEPGAVLSGGRKLEDLYGEVHAPNISPSKSGVGTWSSQDLVRAIRLSENPEGEALSPKFHRGMEWMADEDVYSIVAYLRTVTPVDSDVQRRSLSTFDRYTVGIMDKSKEVEGYVPALDPKNMKAYGQYLTNHVARCSTCHNSPGTLLSSESYLAGGQEFEVNGEVRLVPNITGSETFGIGSWDEEEIVHYLQTGRVPGNRVVDPAFCPVGFYRNASEKELLAIAHYLRSVQS